MLQLGSTAPNFTQQSSQGQIDFYDWGGDSWVVFFSHPVVLNFYGSRKK